jgi:hypothetical protein
MIAIPESFVPPSPNPEHPQTLFPKLPPFPRYAQLSIPEPVAHQILKTDADLRR